MAVVPVSVPSRLGLGPLVETCLAAPCRCTTDPASWYQAGALAPNGNPVLSAVCDQFGAFS